MRATLPTLGLCLAVAILLPLCKAQASDSANLTLTFNNHTGDSYVTFTTSSVPFTITCLNLDDIFTAEDGTGDIKGVEFSTTNATNYSPQTNYTSVFYQQVNATGSGTIGDDQFASRSVQFYGGKNCMADPDWYGLNCQSADGETYSIGSGIQSFSIVSIGEAVKGDSCWSDLAENGESGAAGLAKGGFAAVLMAAVASLMLSVF